MVKNRGGQAESTTKLRRVIVQYPDAFKSCSKEAPEEKEIPMAMLISAGISIGSTLTDYNTSTGKYLGARAFDSTVAEDFLARLTTELNHVASSERTYHRIAHQVYKNVCNFLDVIGGAGGEPHVPTTVLDSE